MVSYLADISMTTVSARTMRKISICRISNNSRDELATVFSICPSGYSRLFYIYPEGKGAVEKIGDSSAFLANISGLFYSEIVKSKDRSHPKILLVEESAISPGTSNHALQHVLNKFLEEDTNIHVKTR